MRQKPVPSIGSFGNGLASVVRQFAVCRNIVGLELHVASRTVKVFERTCIVRHERGPISADTVVVPHNESDFAVREVEIVVLLALGNHAAFGDLEGKEQLEIDSSLVVPVHSR